jgi:hypothetical protein
MAFFNGGEVETPTGGNELKYYTSFPMFIAQFVQDDLQAVKVLGKDIQAEYSENQTVQALGEYVQVDCTQIDGVLKEEKPTTEFIQAECTQNEEGIKEEQPATEEVQIQKDEDLEEETLTHECEVEEKGEQEQNDAEKEDQDSQSQTSKHYDSENDEF